MHAISAEAQRSAAKMHVTSTEGVQLYRTP
jgi:hypothetical protein